MDFKERLSKISQRNMKVKHVKHKYWPIEKKIEVVSQYLVLGDMKLVAAVTGVSHGVVRQWKIQPWWPELEKEIRATQNIEMDTKLSRIVDKSLDAVLDRLENGDFVLNKKTGELARQPAALKDVHRVSTDMISKRELLRGNATERKEVTQVSVDEHLKLLAQEFAKWVGKDKPPVIELNPEDVTDVEPKAEGDEEGQMDSPEDVSDSIYDSDDSGGLESSDEGEQMDGELD
jgi:hypothetical protein